MKFRSKVPSMSMLRCASDLRLYWRQNDVVSMCRASFIVVNVKVFAQLEFHRAGHGVTKIFCYMKSLLPIFYIHFHVIF